MSSNYAAIIRENLAKMFTLDLNERAGALPARLAGGAFTFKAFGAECRLALDGVRLDGRPEEGPMGIIISLYALHAVRDACRLEPFKSFKEMPDSAPYAGAFNNRTEHCLVPAVARLNTRISTIYTLLEGSDAPAGVSGDLAFVVRPLPKIALCYLFYFADDDFPAGVTCLYSNNADRFLPTDALADLGEYTSKVLLAAAG
ncbi:MAG: DUF3786 domain-containing protein [Desulfobacteraceae bacterium]|nr:MAG: DUF3786 domain-containing protein [Desulfobacteraceae bacterium]